jgi:hypothetical protein
LTAILREAWNTSQQSEDKREKIHALSLAKDCYLMKLDLLTNATVVDDAIRFVSSSSITNKEKAKAVDCLREDQDNSRDDIQGSEEENKQQQHTRGITPTTTNQTF